MLNFGNASDYHKKVERFPFTIRYLFHFQLMDQLPTDDMRAHILKISKRSYYNDDDKSCFQQMIMLLNSLEALSQDQSLVGDDFTSMDYSIVSFLR